MHYASLRGAADEPNRQRIGESWRIRVVQSEKDPGQQKNIAESDTSALSEAKKVFTRETDGFYRPFVEEVELK